MKVIQILDNHTRGTQLEFLYFLQKFTINHTYHSLVIIAET